MPTYTVHAPPPRKGEAASAPECFVFVRDGFHFWAFLLTPFWLLWRRLWLAFALYLLVSIVIAVGSRLIGAGSTVQLIAGLLIALLIGFEASTIRRRKLAWRRWTMLGFVIGEDVEIAECRFFAEWVKRANKAPPPAAPPHIVPPAPREPAPAIIGLFPEPESPR